MMIYFNLKVEKAGYPDGPLKVVSSEMDREKWYQLIGLPLTKRRPNFRLDLSIPQGVRSIQS